MTILFDSNSSPRTVHFSCNVCQVEFVRSGSKLDTRILTKSEHFCSPKCAYAGRKPKAQINVVCETCSKQVSKQKSWVRNHSFCSRECYWAARKTNQDFIHVESMNNEQVWQKISETKKQQFASGEITHPMLGKSHSEETKKKISDHHIQNGCFVGERNPMFGKRHSSSIKDKMSELVSQSITDGNRKSYGKNNHLFGLYLSHKTNIEMYYRSSWELACMKWLDANPNVISYEYEKIRIPYVITEKSGVEQKRYYIPDFLITFADGSKELWEIKPEQFVNNHKTQLKSVAALEWCQMNSVSDYKIMTKTLLTHCGIL